MAVNLILFGATGLGLLAVSFSDRPAADVTVPPAAITAPATVLETMASSVKLELAKPAKGHTSPAGAYGPDGVFIPAGMTLEEVYAEHDAEVARLMAAMPDDSLLGATAYVDEETGEETSIDLIAF
jgi:hypothetical protein